MLERQHLHAAREVQDCEESLQCVIGGVGGDSLSLCSLLERKAENLIFLLVVDQTLIRFLYIDPQDPDREFHIVLDSSSRLFKGEYPEHSLMNYETDIRVVAVCHPPIATLPLLVDRLNSSRDMFTFIRDIRAQFVQMVSDGVE